MNSKEIKARKAIRLGRIDEDIDIQCNQARILLQNTYPKLSTKFIDEVVKEGRKYLIEMFVKQYVSMFVEPELDSLIRFWSQGVGCKLTSKSFRQDLYDMGEEWANNLHRDCALEINEEKHEA